VTSGTVQFTIDEHVAGSVTLVGGRASMSPSPAELPTGPHVMVVRYAGDASFTASAASFEQTVGTGVTATEVTSSKLASSFGEALTLTATVRSDEAGTPSGAIDVRVDGEPVCAGVTLEGSARAQCIVPAPMSVGEHDVVASYSGDQTFSRSEGRAIQRVSGHTCRPADRPGDGSPRRSLPRERAASEGPRVAHATRPGQRRRAPLRARQADAAAERHGRTALTGGRVRIRARIAGHDRRRVAVERLAECSTSAARRIGTVRSDRRGRLVATLPGPGRYRLRAADGSTRSLPIVVTAAPPPAGGHR
jgi:hypothetical protein